MSYIKSTLCPSLATVTKYSMFAHYTFGWLSNFSCQYKYLCLSELNLYERAQVLVQVQDMSHFLQFRFTFVFYIWYHLVTFGWQV